MAQALRERLKQLAGELEIRSGPKLYQAAKRRGVGDVTQALAAEAVRGDVARQVLAAPFRSTGKSAAEGPNERLQVDLMDMSQNARTESGNKYAVMLADVYTRESRAFAIQEKTPQVVNAVLRPMLENLTNGRKDYSITSDGGGEFARIGEILPAEAVHRQKQAANDISVLDRQMQTIKRDLAAVAARMGGDWDTRLSKVIQAYNARDHEAVFGPPEDVELVPEQEFYVLKANADKFAQNRAQSHRQMASIRESETIRPPVDRGGRSFNPSYGDPVAIRSVTSGYVTTANGDRYVTKTVQAVPRDSIAAVGRLTDPALARRQRLQPDADRLEEYLIQSGPMRFSELERQIRVNRALPSVKRALTRARMTLRSFLRAFPQVFQVTRGMVSPVNDPEDQVAEEPLQAQIAEGPPRAQVAEEPPQATAAAEPAQTATRTPFMKFLDQSRERSSK
jgi:hypothetical protein